MGGYTGQRAEDLFPELNAVPIKQTMEDGTYIGEARAEDLFPELNDAPRAGSASTPPAKEDGATSVADGLSRIGETEFSPELLTGFAKEVVEEKVEPFGRELLDKGTATIKKHQQGASEIYDLDVDGDRRDMMLVSESIQAGGGLAMDVVSSLWAHGAPEALKDATSEAVASTKDWLAKSPTAQKGLEMLGKGMEYWGEFAKEHPADARSIEAVFDIATIAFPRKSPVPESLLDKTGKVAHTSIKKRVAEKLRPDPNTGPGWTESGVGTGRSARYAPNDLEKEMYDTVAAIPKLRPSGTNRHYAEVITNQIGVYAEKLVEGINDFGNPHIDVGVLKDRLLQEMADLPETAEGFGLIGGAGKVAQNILEETVKIIDASDGTALGILTARKQYDALIRRVRGDGVFNAERESGVSAASKVVRDLLNETVDAAVPDVKVQELLKKQHQLYKAHDVATPRAMKEAENALQRIAASIQQNPIIPGTILSAGMAGSMLTSNPAMMSVALGLGGVYIGGKLLPGGITGSKKFLNDSLKLLDSNIGKAQKSKIAGLRADRAILVDYIHSLEQQEQQGEQ